MISSSISPVRSDFINVQFAGDAARLPKWLSQAQSSAAALQFFGPHPDCLPFLA